MLTIKFCKNFIENYLTLANKFAILKMVERPIHNLGGIKNGRNCKN